MAAVVMHASSISPGSIDFTIFECFLKGYDVDETVQFLVSRNAALQDAGGQMGPKVEGAGPSRSIATGSPLGILSHEKESNLSITSVAAFLEMEDGELNRNEAEDTQTFSLNNVYNILAGRDIRNNQTQKFSASALGSNFLLEDVEEHYRLFQRFVKKDNYLRSPYAFLTNHYVQMLFSDRLKMVNMYYDFEPIIYRYFFGNKYTHSSTVELMLRDIAFCSSRPSYGSTHGGDLMQSLRVQIEAIQDCVVKRQLENLKQVCTTITNMYHCKGDRFIPHDVPLRIAVEKCFGFKNPLSSQYAVAVFGYEHCFNSRMLDRFKTCEDCYSFCNLLAAFWCDDSGLFLKDDSVTHWKAMGRHFEDNRALGEIHLELFGEPLRPRWQQQLDGGVQRVIGATTSTEKSPGGSPFEQTVGGDRGGGGGPLGTSVSMSGSPPSPLPTFGLHLQGGTHSNPSMCSNSRFTKRFCFEFGSIMKACSKVAFSLSSGHLNDAIDCFYTRVLHPLEQMGARDAPDVTLKPCASPVSVHENHPSKEMHTSPSAPTIGEIPARAGASIPQSTSEPTINSRVEGGLSFPVKEERKRGGFPNSTANNSNNNNNNNTVATNTQHIPAASSSLCTISTVISDTKVDALGSNTLIGNNNAVFSPLGNRDKLYLLELCSLFTKLPPLWNNAFPHMDSSEKEAFANFTLALKSLTQLLMSKDD